MSSESPLPNGTRLGSYRITGKLGEGGMGTVYAAEHVELGKRVAIKTLRQDLAANAQVRARFVREGRAAAAVRHPHVVDVHDVGVHGEIPYLVMELLEGEDLSTHVAKAGRLGVQQVADLIVPVLTAMAEAHSAGIVHRDLKPENIFLQRGSGGIWVPKVLDFGISKLRETESLSLTGSGTLLGTPYYMAPEQASSAKDVDARADLYSIGVILYHCVSGNVPFQGTSLVQVIGQILTAAPPPLRESVPDLPGAFEQIVSHAMAKDVNARYQTAQLLGRALLPFASDRTRINYEHEFAAPAHNQSGFAVPTSAPPAAKPQVSTLDPTANSVVIETARPRSRARSIGLIVLGGAVVAAVAVAMRVGGGTSTSTSTSAGDGVGEPQVVTPPVQAQPAVPAAPTAPPLAAVADAGTQVPQAAHVAQPERPHAQPHRSPRKPKPPLAATPTAPPAAKPPATDPFSERK